MSTRYVWGKYNTDRVPYEFIRPFVDDVYSSRPYPYEDVGHYGPEVTTLYYAKYSSWDIDGPGLIKLSGLVDNGTIQADEVPAWDMFELEVNTRYAYIFSVDGPISKSSLSAEIIYVMHSGSASSSITAKIYFNKTSGFVFTATTTQPDGYRHYKGSTVVKDTYISDISSAQSSTYPRDNYSGSYWYVYKGSDNIDPTAVGYSTNSPKGGESITINVGPRSNTYGGTITYKYEVQLSGGRWTNIGSTTSTAKSYVIPKGTTTFRARVVASDNMGFTSTDYVTGNQIAVVNNVAPVISGSNQNLGIFTYNPPIISYVITDENNDTVTVTVKLDSSTIESHTVTLGQTYTVPISWWDIGTGTHTVTITANDSQGGTATRTYTFTKNSVGQISFNRLHKKTSSGYQTTYIETDSDSIITNNGQTLSERLSDIASKLSTTINTTPTEMVSRHRLHIKLTSEYTIDYLEMYSTNVKVGSSTLESILTRLESKVGISNSGTVPSNLNFERRRIKNSLGTYDIIYLEGVSEHIIRPCGKSVEESLQAIEAKL